jgi:hypothetical protein
MKLNSRITITQAELTFDISEICMAIGKDQIKAEISAQLAKLHI